MQTKVRGVRLGGEAIDIDASELGALHVAQGESAFAEAVNRGNVYLVASQATVVTEIGPSATSPVLVIANRVGSGKVVKLWYAGAGSLVSPTACAQTFLCLGGYSATAVTETTPAIVRNAKTGQAGDPAGIACLIASTLPAAPVVIAQLGSQASAAITVSTNGFHCGRWFNGSVWANPGFNLSTQQTTASTLFCDFIFEVQDA